MSERGQVRTTLVEHQPIRSRCPSRSQTIFMSKMSESQNAWSEELDLVWFEWGFYALSASKAIFRARTYMAGYICIFISWLSAQSHASLLLVGM